MKVKILAILISACLLLYSCGGAAEKKADTPTGTENQQTTTQADTIPEATTEVLPDIPDQRFDGYELKILDRNEKHMIFVAVDIFAEAETGEPINDAVFKRNRKIEEQFGIKISDNPVQDPGIYIQKLVNAGDCPYDLMVESTIQSVALSSKNMLVDIKTIPYVDLEKPWWDQSCNNSASVGGKLYYAIGDLIVSDKNGTWGLLFNKNTVKEQGLEDPYALVREGKWTLDKLGEMLRTAAVDVNSNSKADILEDRFGFATESYNNYIMTVGAGGRIADKDAQDMPVLTLSTERSINAYEKALAIANDAATIQADKVTGVKDVWYDGIIPAFGDGRIMFYMGSIALVPMFRGMENEFGILPIPKLDEKQDKYYTTMSIYNNGAIYVPITNSNLERTGILLEALSAESRKTLIPAFYDLTLKTKLSRDNESSEMLDILFKNRILDIGATYNFGGMLDIFNTYKPELVSNYEKRLEKANKDIAKLMEQLQK